VPNSKQRREAARRHLERQYARRQQQQAQRQKTMMIASVLGVLVVAAVIIVSVVMLTNDSNKNAGANPSASASADSTRSPLPARTAAPIASRAPITTAGPCKYAESAASLAAGHFDVGLPPDPSPTPTSAVTATFNTNQGTITATLDAAGAPCNVQSIKYLISKQFYDGTACPRSSNTGIFIIQCGDPSATTGGGPTYSTKDENLTNAAYTAGTIAMANSGADTNGSQFFFITKDSSAALSKAYTVIGHVTAGLDVLQKVAQAGDDGSNSAGGGRPNIDFLFTTVTVS
jgi:peptidyl-prolyl cis-trans isomerase B (cyclophilin B)